MTVGDATELTLMDEEAEEEASQEPLRIIRFQANNFMRLGAVDITPDPAQPLVRITGGNGAGKTCILKAIMAALGSKAACPDVPLKRGREKGQVLLDLGRIIVTRTFTAKGGGQLTVEAKEGEPLSSPQAILDELLGQIAFDPLEFTRLNPRAQRDMLLDLTGLGENLDNLEQQRQKAYDERTNVNRAVKEEETLLAQYDNLPDEAPVVPDVTALQAERRQREQAYRTAREAEDEKRRARESAERRRDETALRVKRLEQELAEAREAAQEAETALESCPEAQDVPQPDTSDLDDQITSAGQTAALAERWRQGSELRKRHFARVARAKELTELIASCEEGKASLIAEADMPLEGLGFAAEGVTFRGLPLEQASDAEALVVSLHIAMSANPTLRVLLVNDGNKLDSKMLELVRQECANQGYQLWMTVVDESGKVGVVIEDGQVAAVNEN